MSRTGSIRPGNALAENRPRMSQRHADAEKNRAADDDAEDFVADGGHVRLLQSDD